jgi:signal transduction histidine kinase
MERLGNSERELLEEQMERREYSAGAVVFVEGEPGASLAIVWRGRLAILKEEQEGTYALLAYRGPGEIVGEMGAMTGRPRSATVVAVEDAELLVADGQEFRTLVQDHPGITESVLDVLTDRLQAADEARSELVHQEEALGQQLERASTEANRLTDLLRLRQETVDIIVHDLRNPLGIVETCLQMLRITVGDELPDDAKEFLTLAEKSNSRVLAMVESLLESSRQEKMGITLDARELDLGKLLREGMENARPTARKYDQRLELALPEELPPLIGDEGLLTRVLTNILDNALAYTPRGGRVTVEAEVIGDEVWVSVVDTGPGVPMEHREAIFQRFVKVPGAKGHRQGFGLGLYFCRHVIEAHEGRIWVEDGPKGTGSRFTFTLPITEGA